MSTRQERLDKLLLEMNRIDTFPLIVQELPMLIRLAKERPAFTPERVEVLEHLLKDRGVLRVPAERQSERAMRLSSLDPKKGLDSSD